MTFDILSSAWNVIVIINTIAALITVFREKRDIAATWAWLLVLVALPVIGFIIYLFAGKKLSHEKIFSMQTEQKKMLRQMSHHQINEWKKHKLIPLTQSSQSIRELIHFFLKQEQAFLSKNNEIQLFTDGKDKFNQLINDINHAKKYIHIEYYSFYSDELGDRLLSALEDAAKRGVEVKVLYDMFGSHGTTYRYFKNLEKLGGLAQAFFSSKKAIVTTPRLNYHLHRKIVVIDGLIGYIGGFNVGDQYLGKSQKFGYWRDTHLRIKGFAVIELLNRFIMDWNVTCHKTKKERITTFSHYLPSEENISVNGSTNIQIVSSGPDNERQSIKRGYQHMITNADNYIYIQTPYLVPDDSILESLIISAKSGVDVRIMIPSMPDHPFIYRATEYYAKYLVENGIRIFRYDHGFLHAKTIVADDHITSIGSANMDFRSFRLNFEANAFCYDSDLSVTMKNIFIGDQAHCKELTPEYFDNQSKWKKFKQYFSRLLSPTL
ncbi:cardiolipin synthetase [Ligilactobacillus hayakitensis DSM 18933 = JCM 14209]|uniref:Cardiolipin synthase n=1 Tax=Ligilactobacillus hayakitensis DSM 18933 = JCM 14209 TaxID=1423755 RepID=A0A0R1WSW1_9LACO|nr:cardiolipin synthase [Ligilactobacillus hayakitensis]KRM18825.1 cardiolipin synthetase [Ligilactobacillus hayakitensis DSM 18933 = JCM 14209]